MEDALIAEIQRLRKENQTLQNEFETLRNAKRYKLIDRVVNTAYKPLRLIKERRHAADVSRDEVIVKQDTEVIVPRPEITRGRVDIINVNFYDWDGKTVYKGGAERYVYDLACLLKSMGYKPRILQGANRDFEKVYHGVKVIGVKSPSQDQWELSQIFAQVCQGAEFVISSPLELAKEIYSVPCIGINHSVRFDGPSSKTLTKLPKNLVNPYWLTVEAVRNVKYCVCTDTNFVNWMRTRDYELSKKIFYLPNCYDERVFHPVEKSATDKVVFVFPRRIEESRGYKLTFDAYRRVVKKFPNTELHIIGQIQDSMAEKDVKAIMAEFPQNVSHTQYTMDNAYKAYQGADVMLAPTIFMEGMSLSCIEAMASGLPIIATTVGGLPNLVVDHYNGFLILTTVDDLEQAMIELIQDPVMRRKMGNRSLDMARSAFTRQLWEERWRKIIGMIAQKGRA